MKISSSVRHGSALVGIAGALVLSGCAANVSEAADSGSGTGSSGSSSAPSPSTSASPSTGSSSAAAGTGPSAYKDGTYSADGSYRTPETVEKISVSVTLAAGVVTDVQVKGAPQARETEQYQAKFTSGIAALVVGKPIDEISVSRVAGSSLTSTGFNQAIDEIKKEAAS